MAGIFHSSLLIFALTMISLASATQRRRAEKSIAAKVDNGVSHTLKGIQESYVQCIFNALTIYVFEPNHMCCLVG